jgi:transcriptional regulator with XRE-family HTH domain
MNIRRRTFRTPWQHDRARENRVKSGKMLARARGAAELTQLQLAKLIGVHQVRISQFETGISTVPSDLLRPMAKSLGCAPHHFAREYLVASDPDLYEALFKETEQ